MVPAVEASSTAERVHNREEFRQLLVDVKKLPETQRSALLLREMDALSYEEIAAAMETTVPSVKSLLVRARISLAEASQAQAADLRRGPRRALRSGRGPAQGLRPGPPPRSRMRGVRRLPLPGAVEREGAGRALPGRRPGRLQGLHRLQARVRRRQRRNRRRWRDRRRRGSRRCRRGRRGRRRQRRDRRRRRGRRHRRARRRDRDQGRRRSRHRRGDHRRRRGRGQAERRDAGRSGTEGLADLQRAPPWPPRR